MRFEVRIRNQVQILNVETRVQAVQGVIHAGFRFRDVFVGEGDWIFIKLKFALGIPLKNSKFIDLQSLTVEYPLTYSLSSD